MSPRLWKEKASFLRPLLGWALIAVGGGLVGVAIHLLWQRQDAWHTPLYLWLTGLALFLLGSAWAGAISPSPAPDSDRCPRWVEGGLFLLLIGVGIFLRVYRLNTIPPGIFVDETNAAGDALRLLDGWPGSPFGVGWYETPLLYAYYMAGLFRLLGTTYMALKMASVLPAVLTLIAFYLVARFLFGPRVALVALAFFVFNRWHLTMSRWGWNEVAPPLFYLLSLAAFLYGERKGALWPFAGAGIMLGLGMYTYLASRLMALTLFLYLAYRALVEPRFLRRTWKGLLLFLLGYGLTFAPLLTTYAHDPFTLLNRSKQVSILNDMQAAYTPDHPLPRALAWTFHQLHLPTEISLTPLKRSVVKHLRMFFLEGDYNPRHNLPGEPMLDPITAGFFLLGLGRALWKWRDHRYGLLLLGLVIPLLGGVLTVVREAPQAYRTLGVLPSVVLLAGESSVALTTWLASRMRALLPPDRGFAWARWMPWGGLTLLLLLSGGLNLRTFQRWARDSRVWMAFSPMETAVAREVQAHLGTHRIYLSPTLYWGSPLRFLTYQRGAFSHPPFSMIQPVEDLPLAEPVTEDVLFILEPLYADLLELFTEYYPHIRAELVTGQGGIPLFVRVQVPREDLLAIQGLTVRYYDRSGRVIWEGRDRTLRHVWPRDFVNNIQPARVEWTGSVFVLRSGPYQMEAPGGQIWLDGVKWSAPRVLGRGLHALRVVQERPGSPGTESIRLRWRLEGRPWEDVPTYALFVVAPPDRGLWGMYFRGEKWEGPPLFARVDRTLLLAWADPEPMVGPFSVRWLGSLWVPRTGLYRFRVAADDGVRLWLDGKVVGESLRPDTMNQVEVQLRLEEGFHPVRVDYFQRGGAKTITFFWQPPGEPERVVPPHVLVPTPKGPDTRVLNFETVFGGGR